MTKEEAKKILTEYVKACREDDMFTLEQFTYEEVIEAMDIGAEAISVLPVSSDLEEAARHSEILTYPMPEDGDIEKVFKVQEARVFHEIGFIAGANWQKEQMMIQWTGNNLKDLIEFTGKSPRFNEWFKSLDDYEDYVRQHGNIFKMFNDDGSHLEVPVGAWIVKTPDKRCVASKFTLKQPESEKIAAAYQLGLSDKEKQMMKEAVETEVTETCGIASVWFKTKQFKPGQKVRIIIVKED